jgi:hypothetical protein
VGQVERSPCLVVDQLLSNFFTLAVFDVAQINNE